MRGVQNIALLNPPNRHEDNGRLVRDDGRHQRLAPYDQDDIVGFADGDLRYSAFVILLHPVSVLLQPPC